MSSAAVENAADASQIKADAMNANASPYSEGDKVLISSSSLLYEAKVEKSTFETKGGWKYFIHYVGWNKKYDEWVPYQRLKKYDDNAKIHKPGRGSAQKNKKKKTDDDEDYDNMVRLLSVSPLPFNPSKGAGRLSLSIYVSCIIILRARVLTRLKLILHILLDAG
jgi:hypothetical protein